MSHLALAHLLFVIICIMGFVFLFLIIAAIALVFQQPLETEEESDNTQP